MSEKRAKDGIGLKYAVSLLFSAMRIWCSTVFDIERRCAKLHCITTPSVSPALSEMTRRGMKPRVSANNRA